MGEYKHISFDLDGTLVDTFSIMEKAWNHATGELNLNCSFKNYRKLVGLPFGKILEILDLSAYEPDLSHIYFSQTKSLAGEVELFSGVKEVLDCAFKDGLSTSIITSKPRDNAAELCNRLGIHTDFLICGDDHPLGKPNAFIAEPIFSNGDVAPHQSFYVGDMMVDLQFAINVGMDFVFFDNQEKNRRPQNIVNEFRSISRLGDLVELWR